MALTYDLTKVEGVDDLNDNLIEAIIFGTIATGIGDITEKNYEEFFVRIAYIEKLNGTFLRKANFKPRPITLADVRALIGLKTNVFPEETRAKFIKRQTGFILANILRDAKREEDREKEEVA